jgi:hypothetical protein
MGDIIQFRDYQSKRAKASLEQQAVDIITFALMGAPCEIGKDPVIYIDTSLSEYCAPPQDSA